MFTHADCGYTQPRYPNSYNSLIPIFFMGKIYFWRWILVSQHPSLLVFCVRLSFLLLIGLSVRQWLSNQMWRGVVKIFNMMAQSQLTIQLKCAVIRSLWRLLQETKKCSFSLLFGYCYFFNTVSKMTSSLPQGNLLFWDTVLCKDSVSLDLKEYCICCGIKFVNALQQKE